MTSPTNLTSLTPGNYIELFDLDATAIGGNFYRFTTHNYTTTQVEWQGNVYATIPAEFKGFEAIGQSGAPPRPTFRVANVNKVFLPAILSLGDLVGAKLTRWRTFTKYLDGQAAANPDAYFAPQLWYVQQMTEMSEEYIEWQMGHYLDREGLRLPREQVLRDINFPGVSLYRQR